MFFCRFYGVVVDLTPNSDFDLNDDYPNIGPYMPGAPYYIAGAWDISSEVPWSFTVGDGQTTVVNGVTYVNVALNSGTSYALLVRIDIVSDNGQPLVQYSEKVIIETPLNYSPAGVAIGIILLIAGIAIVVVVVIVLWWYR